MAHDARGALDRGPGLHVVLDELGGAVLPVVLEAVPVEEGRGGRRGRVVVAVPRGSDLLHGPLDGRDRVVEDVLGAAEDRVQRGRV